jgi:hypothetical protein
MNTDLFSQIDTDKLMDDFCVRSFDFCYLLRGGWNLLVGGFHLRGCSTWSFHPAVADGNLLFGVPSTVLPICNWVNYRQ